MSPDSQSAASAGPGRPLLRGWLHALAVPVAIAGTLVLWDLSRGSATKQWSLLLYGLTLVALFTTSAAYHIPVWSPERRAVLRRFDRSTIFLLIAGTYTPIVAVTLRDPARIIVLATVWTLALIGVGTVVGRLVLPRWSRTALYLALGWISVFVAPLVAQRVGWTDLGLVLAAGVLYSFGAVAYGLKRPVLWSRVFGYHELFHLLVIAASASFFAFMLRDVVPLN